MSFAPVITSILGGLPSLIMDIERLHNDKTGEAKKQLALDVFASSLHAVEASSPRHAEEVQQIAEHAGGVIDHLVSIFHLAGLFRKKAQPATAGGA